jgi:alpha-beta hydrolase superfamily lysophospholipase
MGRRYYAMIDGWRNHQHYLPARMQLRYGREPVEEWWSWCRAEIHLDRFSAPAAPLTVILLHGGGGYGRLLAPFGLMLHKHGFETVLPDLPGYGLSVASTEYFVHERWVDCVADLIEAELQRGARPVVVVGMSMGGYLAYLSAAQSRKAAGVIATTLADPRLPIVRDQFARHPRLNRLVSPLLPPLAAAFGNVRLPVRWFANMQGIANDPELTHMLCHDPIGGGNHVPLRFLRSILAIRPAIEPEDFDLCPVLFAQPAVDLWTTLEASQPFFDRIKGPKEFVMLENCGHFPIEEPGVSQFEHAVVTFLNKIVSRRVVRIA